MGFKGINVLIFVGFFGMNPVHAQDSWFLGYRLSPPPVAGSAESDEDFIRLHEYQDHRTPGACEAAESQSDLTLENGFGPETGVLTKDEVRQVRVLGARVIAKALVPVLYFKNRFKRPRPFRTDPTLSPCISKPRFGDDAYPSGHSTVGYALALVLSKRFPEKRDLILRQGLQIGENRLIGGVHHPSDVIAGRRLAEQVVRGMRKEHHLAFMGPSGNMLRVR